MSEAQLYVFYTRAIGHDETWTYKYPKGWFMLGTDAIKTNVSKFLTQLEFLSS